MTNQQDRDRELLENWEKFEGGKYHKTVFWSDDGHHKFIVENLLAATERLTEQRVRAECLSHLKNLTFNSDTNPCGDTCSFDIFDKFKESILGCECLNDFNCLCSKKYGCKHCVDDEKLPNQTKNE